MKSFLYYLIEQNNFNKIFKNNLKPAKIIATNDELSNNELFNKLNSGLETVFKSSNNKLLNSAYDYLKACINAIQEINISQLGVKNIDDEIIINLNYNDKENSIKNDLTLQDYKNFEIAFGECCVGLLLSKFKNMQVIFLGGNEPLIDIIGIQNNIEYKISCKSGTSRTVHAPSFKTILNNINELVNANKLTLDDKETKFINALTIYDNSLDDKQIKQNTSEVTNVIKFKYFISNLQKLLEAKSGPYQKQYENYKKFINYLNDNWSDVLNSIMLKYLNNHYQCYITFNEKQIIFKFIKMNSYNTGYSWKFSIGDTSSQIKGFKSHWLQIEFDKK